MTPNDFKPRLYLFVRTDIPSLNPGKAMAQIGHACTKFACEATLTDQSIHDGFKRWLGARNYGTKIVLSVPSLEELYGIFNLPSTVKYLGSIVKDETYPIRDGDFTHYVPVVTCGYLFDHDGSLKASGLLSHLKMR